MISKYKAGLSGLTPDNSLSLIIEAYKHNQPLILNNMSTQKANIHVNAPPNRVNNKSKRFDTSISAGRIFISCNRMPDRNMATGFIRNVSELPLFCSG
jgi:hypothetical protein